eukprot:jgi/Botrbrau1/2318/Bobra.39_1s0007.1
MLHQKTFSRASKRGLQKVVREHYLREDIYSGSPLDPVCPPPHRLSEDAHHYLVVDTNVVLQQISFLEAMEVTDVIVLSTVMEEVKARDPTAYTRLRGLTNMPSRRFYVFANENHRDTYVKALPGESPNDRNDRAIRVAAAWYAKRIPQMQIILLSNDTDNRKRAEAEGLTAMSALMYARSRQDAPDLADLVLATMNRGEDGETKAPSQGTQLPRRPTKRARIYDDHRPMSVIEQGIRDQTLYQGSIRTSRFNPYMGYLRVESLGGDIMIAGRELMNRAMDGDTVAVELLPQSEWRDARGPKLVPSEETPAPQTPEQGTEAPGGADALERLREEEEVHLAQVAPGEHYGLDAEAVAAARVDGKVPTGKVVGIIARAWRTRGYPGSLQILNGRVARATHGSVLFSPMDRRFPIIRINTSQGDMLVDKRIVVAIDSWEVDSAYPKGHYVKTLGDIGSKEAETDVLLLEHDIATTPFTNAVLACLPPLPWSVTQADLDDPHREDLRHLPVCSVDPPGCRDIDDALHFIPLPNGNVQVGVHIADVTHFLRPGTPLDHEAASRATTTYLVERRIDMLPKPLTEDICSLRSEVDRLAFSVLWEFTPFGQNVSVRFTKSIIKSRAALTYAEAQVRLDDETMTDTISSSLRNLNRLAQEFRRRRMEAGALSLASPEVKFQLDSETLNPLDVGMYQVRESNQMVEEMMLLANTTVAEHILRAYPTLALLRRHPAPTPQQFDPLLEALKAVGMEIDMSSSKALADSLDKLVRSDDPYFNKLVRIMTTRCMMPAAYIGSSAMERKDFYHYGLATELYTHFTSPIRRYADVMVHRLLAASLGLDPLPEEAQDRLALKDLTDNLNVRHRNAQLASRASTELHTLIFFHSKSVVADARVTKIRSKGLVVFVPKFGIEGPISGVADVGPGPRMASRWHPRRAWGELRMMGSLLLHPMGPTWEMSWRLWGSAATRRSRWRMGQTGAGTQFSTRSRYESRWRPRVTTGAGCCCSWWTAPSFLRQTVLGHRLLSPCKGSGSGPLQGLV